MSDTIVSKEIDAKMAMQNPATDAHKTVASAESTEFGVTRETRVPMSIPRIKLQVRDIPGYRQYWFKEENIDTAIQAGYEFVKRSEQFIQRNNVGGAPGVSGNTDMGSNVSLVMGTFESGSAQRLYLMKIRLEWHKDDLFKQVEKQAANISGMFEGQQVLGKDGEISDYGEYTYVGEETRNPFKPIFNRRPPKAKSAMGRRRSS